MDDPTDKRIHNRHASESKAQLGAVGAERRQHGFARVLQGAHCPGQGCHYLGTAQGIRQKRSTCRELACLAAAGLIAQRHMCC